TCGPSTSSRTCTRAERLRRRGRVRVRFGSLSAGVEHCRRMPKITIIGAGSVEFTRNVVADLCSFVELHGSIIVALHDIDDERLAYAQRASESIVRRTGAGYRVEAHRDRRGALGGRE